MRNLRLLIVSSALACASLPVWAETIHAKLKGFEEVPAVSTNAGGEFRAHIDRRAEPPTIAWELDYHDLQGDVLQAHIHVGQTSVSGGVAVWLCSNLPAPPTPAGIPPCPGPHEGTVTGTASMTSVVPPGGANAANATTVDLGAQGIAAGEIDELVDAIRAGATYVNVHTTMVPSGEIRGQVK